MESFSPVPATIGGVLIGLSAAILWIGNGRIAGISGIFGRILPPTGPVRWRLGLPRVDGGHGRSRCSGFPRAGRRWTGCPRSRN